MKTECETCNGKGYVYVLMNYADYHYNGEEPIYDWVPCEDCNEN